MGWVLVVGFLLNHKGTKITKFTQRRSIFESQRSLRAQRSQSFFEDCWVVLVVGGYSKARGWEDCLCPFGP